MRRWGIGGDESGDRRVGDGTRRNADETIRMDDASSTRGRKTVPVELCDFNHQAIAFVGSCPLCRLRARPDDMRPLREGTYYRQDLDRALRTHYVERLEAIVEGHRQVLGG